MLSMRPSGFTLLEILMAVALVAIVSAVALPNFIDFRGDAKAAVTKDRMTSLRDGITKFISNRAAAPSALTDLTAKGAQPNYDPITNVGWNGPYVDGTVPGWNLDGWDTAYQYTAATRTLRSCGPNKACGDADDLVVNF
jgi:prepilin-type N-terminal cleavage/methylation domain-containing protein